MICRSQKSFHRLEWDSHAFKFAVARIESLPDPAIELPLICEELRNNSIVLAYWEAPAGDGDSRVAAITNGGRLINTRMIFKSDLPFRPMRRAFKTVNDPNNEQLSTLVALAQASGWSSRFSLDCQFPKLLFEDLYRSWMENSLSGRIADAVLVSENGGGIEAMVTVAAHDGHGEIGLFSVAEAARGRGVGKKLLADAMDWFISKGCSTASVVTQGENSAAIALYQSCGFSVTARYDVYHFWNHYS